MRMKRDTQLQLLALPLTNREVNKSRELCQPAVAVQCPAVLSHLLLRLLLKEGHPTPIIPYLGEKTQDLSVKTFPVQDTIAQPL